MNELEAARDRILAAWPTLSEPDRQLVLSLTNALADWLEAREVAR